MKKKAEMVSPEIPANSGYKRIELDKLKLDSTNPRLAELGIPTTATPFELLKALWDEMAVEEVAMSIAYSGYFEHEPLFVEDSGDGTYVVIEGNRRLAAVKPPPARTRGAISGSSTSTDRLRGVCMRRRSTSRTSTIIMALS